MGNNRASAPSRSNVNEWPGRPHKIVDTETGFTLLNTTKKAAVSLNSPLSLNLQVSDGDKVIAACSLEATNSSYLSLVGNLCREEFAALLSLRLLGPDPQPHSPKQFGDNSHDGDDASRRTFS